LLAGTPGFYLDFELPAGSERAAELLENRLKHIELVAFQQPDKTQSAVAVELTHRLESVKILLDQGENDPKLYGAITRDAVSQAEISAPNRKRSVCLAVTSDIDTSRGRPSSWSAAIDQLCFGDENSKRLLLISAGNTFGTAFQKTRVFTYR